MITELKIGDKVKLEGYDEAWIGWVTNSSYQISKIKRGLDEITKAMEIEGVGCVVQVTTQQGDNVAEALTFVPNVRIEEFYSRDENFVGRRLIKI